MQLVNAWFYRQMAIWSTIFKRDDMALEYWGRVRALRPRDARPVAAIAHLHAAQGRRGAAIQCMAQALAIEPGQADGWFNLGFLQQEEGEHAAAITSFERALAINEKLDRAFYGKALSLIKLEQVEAAIAPLQKNTELQPMSPYGWYQLAHVYHRLGDAERVAKTIRRLAQFEPAVARQLEGETGVSVGVRLLSDR